MSTRDFGTQQRSLGIAVDPGTFNIVALMEFDSWLDIENVLHHDIIIHFAVQMHVVMAQETRHKGIRVALDVLDVLCED